MTNEELYRQYLSGEGGGRLVADDELGVERERTRDADTLALAAGELVRVAVLVEGL